MSRKYTYPGIDMQETGKRIKYMLESAGYTPRMIQRYLHLACVQPIYRWYNGLILPSVDHLFALSKLLGVHMEELLVSKNNKPTMVDINVSQYKSAQKRYEEYLLKIYESVA